MYRVGTIILCVIALAGVVALVGYGMAMARDLAFANNGAFTIAKIDVKTHGHLMTEAFVRQCLPVSVGTNLFAVDIGTVKDDFMAQAHAVRHMTIARHLPDTLRIDVWERDPIAWLGGRHRYIAIDREGFVFSYRARMRRLPMVTGLEDAPQEEGHKMEGLIDDALAVIEYCENETMAPTVKLRRVHLAEDDALPRGTIQLELATGELIYLWWHRAPTKKVAPLADMIGRLNYMRDWIERFDKEGMRIATMDLTFDEYPRYCPATLRQG
jgi:hypothetical protein